LNLEIPEPSLVVLIGPSGAGKSTFAARHFSTTEVVSSDECRALVADDETNMSVTPAAFRVLYAIARERLRAGRLTVIDATNVKAASRKPLVAMARKFGRPAVAIAFDLPLELCLERNAARAGRSVPADVVPLHHQQMTQSLPRLGDEGFAEVYLLSSAESIDRAVVDRHATK
jgi:predicted kinase